MSRQVEGANGDENVRLQRLRDEVVFQSGVDQVCRDTSGDTSTSGYTSIRCCKTGQKWCVDGEVAGVVITVEPCRAVKWTSLVQSSSLAIPWARVVGARDLN